MQNAASSNAEGKDFVKCAFQWAFTFGAAALKYKQMIKPKYVDRPAACLHACVCDCACMCVSVLRFVLQFALHCAGKSPVSLCIFR